MTLPPMIPAARHILTYATGLALALLSASWAVATPAPDAATDEADLTVAFLDDNTGRCLEALGRAARWLDGLEVNPLELRRYGIKGKKKLAELLDAYLRLQDVAGPEAKARFQRRAREVAAVTADAAYHDMLAIDDLAFKQDATSYLRVAYLMDCLGLDTTAYRKEIQKCLPRLNAHLPTRGVDQRMAFDQYYRHFGLPEPFPLASAFQAGFIKTRPDPRGLALSQIYDFTHEVFVPYDFGRKLDTVFFSAEDRRYLRDALVLLTTANLQRQNPDITAELCSCLSYLKITDVAVYRQALEFFLATQRPEGSWGDYEFMRPGYGPFVDQGYYLHTTLVVMDALITAFCFR